MINGPPISLKQAADDTKPGSTLGSPEMRARVKGKKTGPISLNELKGTVTGMPTSIYGTWNVAPTNTWQGWPEYTRARTWYAGSDSGDFTKDFYVGGSVDNIAYDAFVEVQLCGYALPGTYNLTAHCNSTGNNRDAPYSFSVVCFSSGWMRGNVQVVFNDVYVGAYQYNETVTVPSGHPYVSLIGYQFLLKHSANCPPLTNYYSTFTDCRLRKA